MGDNIPSTSSPHRKRSKKKFDRRKLPTPPPDPNEKEDFLAYLESLQGNVGFSRSTSFAPAVAAEDAFDHLEKLYKLMEQMLELKEQNAKLQRRVRDLEFANNLEKMKKELEEHYEDDCPDLTHDTAFAETILESIISDTKLPRFKSRRQRTRSGSVSTTHEPNSPIDRRASCDVTNIKNKVSKWTKVKAAFKWEKASPTVSDAKSQDSGIGGFAKNVEVARYLRVPSGDEHGHSPVDSGTAEVSTPGTLSEASSQEDFHRTEIQRVFEDSEDEHNIPSKEGSQKSNKSHKTPWAKMKNIIQTKNSFKKKHSDQEESFSEASDIPIEVIQRYQTEDESAPKWLRVKRAFVPSIRTEEDEIQLQYKLLQNKLSLEFQEKINEWERMKQNSPTTSNPPIEETKDQAFLKKMEEWEKIKSQRTIPMTTEENLAPEFKKKLQEWEKIRKSSKKGPRTKKELQWFDKELNKIEDEKQRLEFERQKFLAREEALSKLRNSVIVGGLKKDVLIETPSGVYHFEGISRKFTQKLYEWEKAQGIEPESSTFALLNLSLKKENLVRSKSADSVAISVPNLVSRPSSLSLNHVDHLEFEAEPEALIVEVEDIEEETAAPLPTLKQKTELPIYQREEFKTMCEGETVVAPKVRRSESAKAQNNYNLIEEVFSILKNLTENEGEIQKAQEALTDPEQKNIQMIRLKMFDESQKAMSLRLHEKIVRLQEANTNVFSNEETQNYDTFELVQDLTLEIFQLTEKLQNEINERNVYEVRVDIGACCLNQIIELGKEIRNKILDVRRNLSHVCTSAPKRLYQKSDNCNQSTGAIKKKLRYRQRSIQNVSDSEEEEMVRSHKKLTRTTADDSPVTVLVKTTRKIFTPFVQTNPSPVLTRKTKEISPSIRLMMAKYNKISEDTKSISSGSGSPTTWRSPVLERRVKAQTEKYQAELQIQKSSSTILAPKPVIEISKSCSAGTIINDDLSVTAIKNQKAKEEFLKATPVIKEVRSSTIHQNRYSQISVESSESEPFTLMKSASAGMINVDLDVYRQIDPELHHGGYVSLPRNTKQPKDSLFSNIASKFRKVKMRKGKERMNAVSTLCRQSLLVDIGNDEKKMEKKEQSWIKRRIFHNQKEFVKK